MRKLVVPGWLLARRARGVNSFNSGGTTVSLCPGRIHTAEAPPFVEFVGTNKQVHGSAKSEMETAFTT